MDRAVTRLTAIQGGGQRIRPGPACRLCAVSHHGECNVLARHVQWLQLKSCSPNTIRDRRDIIYRLARWLADSGRQPVLDATAADLAAWRAGLTVGDKAVLTYAGHVRRFYAWCQEEGIREDNPAARLALPRLPRRLPRPVPEAELMLALESAPPRLRLMLVLAGWCGLRAKEIAGLTRECILDTVQPPVILVAAASSKGRRERIVPVSSFVLAEIRAANLPSSGWVFPRHDGGRGPNTPQLVSKLCNDHLHSAGPGASLHTLRHRALSQAYIASRDLRAVQEIAGHASPRDTAAYAAFANQSAIDALEALPVPPAS